MICARGHPLKGGFYCKVILIIRLWENHGEDWISNNTFGFDFSSKMREISQDALNSYHICCQWI